MSEEKQQKQEIDTPYDKYSLLANIKMPYEPSQVRETALKEILSNKGKIGDQPMDSPISRSMTLREFENGVLMSVCLNRMYQTLATQLSIDFQKQYKCDNSGKKTLAEVAAINYCRVLDIQKTMNNFLQKDSYGELTVKIMSMLSKEQDRAQRHYLTALQSLEMGLQPPLNVNIKTTTTNIANQQAIQQVGEQTNVKG